MRHDVMCVIRNDGDVMHCIHTHGPHKGIPDEGKIDIENMLF